MNQVLSGLNFIDQSIGTRYILSKIYYVPAEDGSFLVYQTLIRSLIKHYYQGKGALTICNSSFKLLLLFILEHIQSSFQKLSRALFYEVFDFFRPIILFVLLYTFRVAYVVYFNSKVFSCFFLSDNFST